MAAKEKRKIWLVMIFVAFVVYFFCAARPVPPETVLQIRWLSSLESDEPVFADGFRQTGGAEVAGAFPFMLGGHFGYFDSEGRFAVNQMKEGNLSLSQTKWAQYGAEPDSVEVLDSSGALIETIENPHGYPMFLDGRTFILGSEQNSIAETDGAGGLLWEHEFAAPLTCADAASGFVLTGSIDGVAEILDFAGRRIFSFEPGGSQYSVILGCAFSRDGSRFAIISGIGEQRFLLLERFGAAGGEYKVVYHEFLGAGFRRPAHVAFIDQDRKVVFEREGGVGIYNIGGRGSLSIDLEGEIAALDSSGGEGRLFVIVKTDAGRNKLVGINLPGKIFMRAPFVSDDVFMGRAGSRLFLGGGTTLASFELEKK